MSARPPTATITPRRGWADLNLRETWQFRDLLLTFTARDLKVRYKQTALGMVWVVFQPLAAALILAMVFRNLVSTDMFGGAPYIVGVFAGTALWGLFNHAASRAGQSMVQNAHLVSKVFFPRVLLPASNVLASMVDFAVTLVVLAIMIISMWHLPGATILLAPVCVLLLTMMALGFGLLTTSLAVTYRDVQHILPVVLQLLFFISAIFFDVSKMGQPHLYLLNPIAPIMQAWRWSVLGVGEVYWGFLAYSAGFAIALLVIGALVFRRMERNFADVV